MNKKTANRKSISRFSHYRKVLMRLREIGFDRVFSETLGRETGVTAAQVRKDFSLFGISGNKRGGYVISDILTHLDAILHKQELTRVVIAGAGNIGRALIHYSGFKRDNIEIAAAFDIDPAKINRKFDVPVLPLAELESFVRKEGIEIGVIAVPDTAAQQVFEVLARAGIKGILNFTTITFKDTEDIVINNVYLQFELENLVYFIRKGSV